MLLYAYTCIISNCMIFTLEETKQDIQYTVEGFHPVLNLLIPRFQQLDLIDDVKDMTNLATRTITIISRASAQADPRKAFLSLALSINVKFLLSHGLWLFMVVR